MRGRHDTRLNGRPVHSVRFTLKRQLRLRSFVAMLLVATSVITLVVVGSAVLAIRLPQITTENMAAARRQADELAARVETLLGSAEQLLTLHGRLLDHVPTRQLHAILDGAVRPQGPFDAVYVVSPDALVEAAGVRPALRNLRAELLGSDFSANRLYRNVEAASAPAWSGKFLSALSGEVTVGLAVPAGKRVVVGELALRELLQTVQIAAGVSEVSTWVIDRSGELVADTQSPRNVGVLNLSGLAPVRAALAGEALPLVFEHEGVSYHPAVTRSDSLNWYFLVRMPAGLDNPRIRSTTVLVVAGFAATMLIGLMLAPVWAARMARPMQAIIERAGQVADGDTDVSWPRGGIEEFNRLSADLETMAATIREREQRFHAIFNASPVAMVVAERTSNTVLDVNDAWVALLGFEREEAVGRTGLEIGVYPSADERKLALAALGEQQDKFEIQMVRRDGTPLTVEISARTIASRFGELWVIVNDDVTEKRRLDAELRGHRERLEELVEARTHELKAAQTELIQAERLATIGQLTATVSHELRNPLGTIEVSIESLKLLSDTSDPRTERTLARLQRSIARCLRITDELLDFTRTRPLKIESVPVDAWCRATVADAVVPEDCETVLQCDSGANALIDRQRMAQALLNVLQNAWQAAPSGDEQSSPVRVTVATRARDGDVEIRVTDNGVGIDADLGQRIFDPLFSTKMFGVGLGLPLVKRIMEEHSGTVVVESTAREGTTVTLTVPAAS